MVIVGHTDKTGPDSYNLSLGDRRARSVFAYLTVNRFPDQSRLVRDPRDPGLLQLTLPVPGSAVVRLFPDYFQKTLGVPFYARFDDGEFPRPPIIWCSWTSYYAEVKEDDIVRNAPATDDHFFLVPKVVE